MSMDQDLLIQWVMAARGMDYDEQAEYRVLEDSEDVRHIVIPHVKKTEAESTEELEQRVSKLL
jgi:hypothetical protein